jgi:hypothetical protein
MFARDMGYYIATGTVKREKMLGQLGLNVKWENKVI